MFAFISLLFDLSHADVDLVTREFRLEETVFFTDSRNDLPLALAVGDCETVNPDPTLKKTALEKGWRIHAWTTNC